MIETHVHILPLMDDGVENVPEAIRLIKAFIQEGYQHIIATPHFHRRYWEPTRHEIQQGVENLNRAIRELNWNINIYPGCELRLTPNLFEEIPMETFMTLNMSRYLLVDVYPDFDNTHYDQILSILANDLIPVIAHPERYPYFTNSNNVKKIKESGALFQLTISSLFEQKRQIAKQALQLLKNNHYEIIGSDSHNPHHRFYPFPRIKELLLKEIGAEKSQLLFDINCAKILGNKLINFRGQKALGILQS